MYKRNEKKLFIIQKDLMNGILERAEKSLSSDDEKSAAKSLATALSISYDADNYTNSASEADKESYGKIKNKLNELLSTYQNRFKKKIKSSDFKPRVITDLEEAKFNMAFGRYEEMMRYLDEVDKELRYPHSSEIHGYEGKLTQWKSLIMDEYKKRLAKEKNKK